MAKFALLFPGQGAQAVGMGKGFYDQFDEAKELYRSANRRLGFDVTALCFEGPAEALTRTETCQPALFVTSLAAFAAFKRVAPASLAPVAAAGLSLGELTALAAAQVFSFEDGCYLVKSRGEAMAECAARNHGAMLAVVGLAGDAVEAICWESGAAGANYNAQDQVVLSGTAEAIAKAEELAKQRGAKRAVKLDVAGAFHCALMQPAAEAFEQTLAKVQLRQPSFPVVSNVTGQPVQDPEEIRRLLVRQIVSPVLWEPSMRRIIQLGATYGIEFPPARVLTALLRRIDSSVKGLTVDEPKDFEKLSALMTQIIKS
ncbi:MAG: ACP S-malonyltransferase [Candidatus Omnitrophica bacterium]|nr:ACP S-malonyltransferase [Candidatus Omnitrophota bacterium]